MTDLQQFDDASGRRLADKAGRLFARTARRCGFTQFGMPRYDFPPLDFRGLGLDPLEAQARAKGERFVTDLPLAWCRGQRAAGFACVPDVGNPFVETTRAILSEGDPPYKSTALYRFYKYFRPRTAAEILGVKSAHPALERPPQALTFPWQAPPPPDAEARRAEKVELENREQGAALGAEHGFPLFGPVSLAKGEVELSRLASILERIRAEGFRLLPGPSGLCTAQLLSADGAYRAIIETGQHRVAALAALGHETAPVWLPAKVVRREEVSAWPGVLAGVFTRAQALAIFDRLFDGRQPPALEAAYWSAISQASAAPAHPTARRRAVRS